MNEIRDVRIGDAERDNAATTLGEHFAAGRLSMEEFDERAEQVSAARFERDLTHMFHDLPQAAAVAEPKESARRKGWRKIAPTIMWALPVVALGLLMVTVLIGAPWLLFMAFWFFALGGFGNWGSTWGGYHHVDGQRHPGHHGATANVSASRGSHGQGHKDHGEQALDRADVLAQRVSNDNIRTELTLALKELRLSR